MTDRLRSNAFHYTLDAVVGALPHPRWELCPVRPHASAWTRGRTLFLRREGRVARFSTATVDFSDEELAHTAHGTGQLYLDVSQKLSPDDFARDLAPLVRSAVCARCPAYDRCPGLFDPRPRALDAAENVFVRDDARVREIIASLRGRVLDVGCGDGPYDDLFAEGARQGNITYVGIDPDGEKIAALSARRPWAELHAVAAEAYLPRGSIDHVLVLRSWNHLRNPVRVLETFAGALTPGGTLTVVDNVPFGLVRRRGHARVAEGSPAVFEHLRNDGAHTAHAAISSALPGLTLLERHEVSPATSNQWLLWYAR